MSENSRKKSEFSEKKRFSLEAASGQKGGTSGSGPKSEFAELEAQLSSLERDLLKLEALKRAGEAPEDADRTFLVLHDFSGASLAAKTQYKLSVRAHVVDKMPMGRILSKWEFYGREFECGNTLIPRPETEDIVDVVKEMRGVREVFDIGTGSGCIAITLKLELPEVSVVAVDNSDAVLATARRNAERLGVEVEFRWGDLLENLEIPEGAVIVANLPYVDRNWDWLDLDALSYEPEEALFAEEGGLALIFRLLRQVEGLSTKKLKVVLEADPSQHKRVVEFAEKCGLKLVEIRNFIVVLEK